MDKDAPNFSSSPSKVYAFWKDFDLEKEKLDIYEKRKKLKENKENSIKKQKIWGVGSAHQEADVTSDEASLLLDYQSEINRADEAEKAFMEVSDMICRAIDPFPVLCRDQNKRIKWDFNEVKPLIGFEPYDDSKEKEPRFLRDYIVKTFLGEGAFGMVFECQKRIDKNMYAVKKILIKDNEKQESILSEVYALSRMEHQNIIRYYDAWIEPYGDDPKELKVESSSSNATSKSTVDPNSNALYIQMQLCDGILYNKLLSKKITKVEELKYMKQITKGLDYLHENGVVHGDLSSKNVFLLNDSEDAIIADFGLVVIPNLPNWDKEGSDWVSEGSDWISEESDQEDGNQEESAQEGGNQVVEGSDWISEESDQEDGNQEESAQEGGNQVVEGSNQGNNQVGNVLYLAPERRKSKGIPLAPSSPKSDIYSLGIIFVELVADFASESPKYDRVRRILKAKSGAKSGELSDEIPLTDHPLLLKMLSSDPQARPSTKEVLEQLEVRKA